MVVRVMMKVMRMMMKVMMIVKDDNECEDE